MSFGLDTGTAPEWASAFRITSADRLTAVREALLNIHAMPDLVRLECEILDDLRIAVRAKRGAPWICQAMRLCEQRRKELSR